MPSETAKASLGYVTAYGAAKRGGYLGTYEEWCALMAEVADHLEQNESLYADTTTAKEAAEAAQGYAEVAQGKAEDAQTAAETAQGKAEDAEDAAEAWAAGTSGGTPSATNNASYYAGQASDSATASAASAASAEAWATGGSSGTSSATNNAKYYSDQAEDSAEAAEAWATGGSGGTASASNNAKYYSEQAATSATAAAAVGTNFAPTFSSSTAYSAGDYVMYNGTQYRFTANHAAGAWTGSDAVAEPISPVVADLKTQISKAFAFNLFNEEDNSFISNHYYDTNGTLQSSQVYSVSNLIPVNGGETLVATYSSSAGLTNARLWTANYRWGNVTGTLSDNGKYVIYNIPQSFSGIGITFNIFATELDKFMVFKGNKYYNNYIKNVALKEDVDLDNNNDFSGTKENVDSLINVTGLIKQGTEAVNITYAVPGSFINATTNRPEQMSSFGISDSIKLYKGQKIIANLQGYRTVVGMINLYDPITGEYETVVASIDDDPHDYEYVAEKDCLIRLTNKTNTHTATTNVVTLETESTVISRIKQEIEEINEENKNFVNYPQMFSNIVFIGDSLTYGHNGTERLSNNYPFYFGKLSVATVSNQGLSGRTTKEWWDELGSTFDFTSFDCAIIYLGTNGGLTDTVATDCNASDYTQNADTNTGCYGKIIGKIKATNPKCKIFCICGPDEYVRRAERNDVIKQIAALYNVGVIDMENCILTDDGAASSVQRYRYRPVDGIHYNSLGYLTFANIAHDTMLSYMETHLSSYTDM